MKPLINDITTDTENPPQFRAIAKQRSTKNYEYPKEFVVEQKGFYTQLAPAQLSVPPAQAAEKVKQALSQQGWKAMGAGQEGEVYWFEATATTKLMRFKDDISIEVRPGSSGSEVHMRSKSRLGRGDFGANAQRIEKFLSLLTP